MIVAPSVLSMDYSRMETQTKEMNESGAQWLHFDVMDGHFVPNLSFGPAILKGFTKSSGLYKDVHVMISDPDFYFNSFRKAGAENYTFHYEALDSAEKIHALAEKIHKAGCSAGLSIKPKTDVSVLEPFLEEFDVFLIMSVEPGFGGQSFMPQSLDKIRELRKMLDEKGLKAHIEVDGGINEKTGPMCREAGADVLVAGSYFFKNDFRKAVASLE